MPHEVETMAYHLADGVPWHRLGVAVDHAMDSEEALVRAGLAWAVRQEPLYLADGRKVGDWQANVRTTDGAILGVVGRTYRPVQNAEAFRFMDALLGEGVRYTTAGSLRGGRRIFLCARLPEDVEILGDAVEPFVTLVNGHDGTMGVRVVMSPVRVVCANTLNLALTGARRSWSTRHTGTIQDRLAEAARTLGLARQYLRALSQEAERLAEQRISLEEYVERLLPLAPDAGKLEREHVEARREDILRRAYVENLRPFHNTAWQLINAIADHVAHAAPERQTKTVAERRAEQVLVGHPLLDRAYAMVAAN